MLCALAPALVLLVAYTPVDINFSAKSVTAVLLYGSACSALSAFARNAGKRKEEELKAAWGGWPSTSIFRHSDPTLDAITKTNLHTTMAKLVPNAPVTTPAGEAADPAKADVTYRAWSEHLRKEARLHPSKYPFVFKENVSYGFHRNLYGLKAFSIMLLLVSALVSGLAGFFHWRNAGVLSTRDVTLAGLFLFGILFWSLGVNPNSVRRAAQDYAIRLLDDCVPKPKPARAPKVSTKPAASEDA
jgi:hypothetical protein